MGQDYHVKHNSTGHGSLETEKETGLHMKQQLVTTKRVEGELHPQNRHSRQEGVCMLKRIHNILFRKSQSSVVATSSNIPKGLESKSFPIKGKNNHGVYQDFSKINSSTIKYILVSIP